MRHILEARQFNTDELGEIFEHADHMREQHQSRDGRVALRDTHFTETLATVFYEPSTRTRLSFEAAGSYLGMPLLSTESAGQFSSAIKGESLEDSIKTIDKYADVIVLRHPDDDSSERAAAVSEVPIINGGAGKNEHPTQALLDMYTIHRAFDRTEGLRVAIGGDLRRGRTARSLAYLLSTYPGNHIDFVSTPELQIGEDVTDHLDETKTGYERTDDMMEALRHADVVYWTRLQKERVEAGLSDDVADAQSHFVINQASLQVMKEKAIIMHPLPRNHEIEDSVDADPRAMYFEQMRNGLYIRMAVLDMVLRSRP